MIRRYLMTSVLIGAVCGVAVAVGMTGLAGRPLFGTNEGAPPAPTPPAPSGRATPSLSAAGSPDSGSIPTAKPTAKPIAVKLDRPTQGGKYGVTTAVASIGQYITWRAMVEAADAGKTFDVEVATRLDGAWTGWSKLTSRVADERGAVVFSWRQRTGAWIKIRFVLPTGPSKALQGRWR